jgi:inner membrane protein
VATIFTHGFVGVMIAHALSPERKDRSFKKWTVACAAIPDADIAGYHFGVPYGSLLGHRGLTHSLAFAVLIGWLAARLSGNRRYGTCFSAVAASHGLLDAMTDGGLGVAFFSPFIATRYFLPWRPVHVSPIGMRFFSSYGMWVVASELLWIWLPVFVLAAAVDLARKKSKLGRLEG